MTMAAGRAVIDIYPSMKGFKSSVNSELNSISVAGAQTGSKLGAALSGAFNAAAAAAAAVSAVVVKVGKDAFQAYGQFEQLVGGVNKLFGSSASTVMKNAQAAFKTAGLSANQYMDNVMKFSASLIQSLGGDTAKAASIADTAIKDMADNVNTFGSNIEDVQNAYQGFAKQNYTMLDNLRLGYGGTKKEMERLLADAEKISGIKYDISSFADVAQAIHVIQEEMAIAGTTTREAATTIEGSVATMKAAWQNLLIAMGSGEGVQQATRDLVQSITTVIKNSVPVIKEIAKAIPQALGEAIKEGIPQVNNAVSSLTGGAITNATDSLKNIGIVGGAALLPLLQNIPLVGSAFSGITAPIAAVIGAIVLMVANSPALREALGGAFTKIKDIIARLMPTLQKIIEIVGKIAGKFGDLAAHVINAVMQIVSRIAEQLAPILDKVVDFIGRIFDKLSPLFDQLGRLIDNILPPILDIIDLIFDAVEPIIDLAMDIVDVLVDTLLPLIQLIIDLISPIVTAFLEPIRAALEFISPIIQFIADILSPIVGFLGDIIGSIVDFLQPAVEALATAFSAVGDAISAIIDWGEEMVNDFLGWIGDMTDEIADFFGWTRDEGRIENLTDSFDETTKNMARSFIETRTSVNNSWNSMATTASASSIVMKSRFTQATGEMTSNAATSSAQIGQTMTNGISNNVNTNKITSLFNGLNSMISARVGSTFGIGTSISDGIASGIISRQQYLSNIMSSIASNIFRTAMSVLRINSPSKVMRDKIGKGVMEGIAVGIDMDRGMLSGTFESALNDSLSYVPSAGFTVDLDRVNGTVQNGVKVVNQTVNLYETDPYAVAQVLENRQNMALGV